MPKKTTKKTEDRAEGTPTPEVALVQKALEPVFKKLGVDQVFVMFGTKDKPTTMLGWRKCNLAFAAALTEAMLEDPAVRQTLLRQSIIDKVEAELSSHPDDHDCGNPDCPVHGKAAKAGPPNRFSRN